MIARASSGSRSSISSIEPLMSANSAVTVLRSPSPIAESAVPSLIRIRVLSAAGFTGAPSGAVHCPQNLKPGGFSKRHLGQTSASALVHCPQNLIPSGFSKPHFEQRILSGVSLQVLSPSSRASASLRSAKFEAFGEPAVNLGEHRAHLVVLTLPPKQAGKAGCCAQ